MLYIHLEERKSGLIDEIQPPNKIVGGLTSALLGAFIGIAVDYFIALPLNYIVLTAIFVIMCLTTYHLFYWRIQANRIYKLLCETHKDLENSKKDLEKEIQKLNNQLFQEQQTSNNLASEINTLRTTLTLSPDEASPALRIKGTRDEYNEGSVLVQN